jgi:hypothetical protein
MDNAARQGIQVALKKRERLLANSKEEELRLTSV